MSVESVRSVAKRSDFGFSELNRFLVWFGDTSLLSPWFPNFYYLVTHLLLRMDRKVSLSVSFELPQVEWLDAQDDNRSEVLRRLVEKERGNE